jgi:quercetin dioxygenase-like cupin family protein
MMSPRPDLRRRGSRFVPFALALATLAAPMASAQQNTAAPTYERESKGTRILEAPGVAIKVLVEAANYGSGDVEVAHLTLSSSSAEHKHGSAEIIYVLEGVLEHIVNGETHRIEPGMVGIVKPGDTVVHKVVSPGPVKALLVWAPGGEAERLAKVFPKTRPVE